MPILLILAAGLFVGVGLLALFSGPTDRFASVHGKPLWYGHAFAHGAGGTFAMLSRSWWALLAALAASVALHLFARLRYRKGHITSLAKTQIHGLAAAYVAITQIFPDMEREDQLKLLVAGDPSRGLRGRYDEPSHSEIRDHMLGLIQGREIGNIEAFILESLVAENKLLTPLLSNAALNCWRQAVELEVVATLRGVR